MKKTNRNVSALSGKKIKVFKTIFSAKSGSFKGSLITVSGLAKAFHDRQLFSDVTMTVNHDDRIAIVGNNGTGKSTLLKILVGIEEADSGRISKDKRLRIGYLPQETRWESLKNTVYHEIHSANLKMAGLIEKKAAYEEKEKADRLSDEEATNYLETMEKYNCSGGYNYQGLIEELLIDFDFQKESWKRKVETLSGGERTKLALAKALVFDPTLLILDEPTNHLDIETVEWLEQFLSGWKKGIICVAHDRYFLDKVCDKTFELTPDGLEKYYCRYSDYVEEKQRRLEAAEREYSEQQRYLKKQQEFISRFRYNAATAARVQSRIKELKKVEILEKPTSTREIKIRFDVGPKICTKVLSINNAVIGPKGRALFSIPQIIEAMWGDKIGIIGNNGIGKSTLLKTIMNIIPPVTGKVRLNEKIIPGYYAQAHEELDPKKSVLDEIAAKTTEKEERIRNVLGRLLFTQDEVKKKISRLSGGELAKVALAELIIIPNNLLLLDEPTNHLDLSSKEAVTEVLKEYAGTILVISHDRYVLNKVCNKIWEIKDGMLTEYLGNYDDYRFRREQTSLPPTDWQL